MLRQRSPEEKATPLPLSPQGSASQASGRIRSNRDATHSDASFLPNGSLLAAVRPWVTGLFEKLDDPFAVAESVRADTSLDDDERHAALRVVRELSNAWWAAREHEPAGG